MRIFELHRDQDVSGVSGTGKVAQGIEFDNGKCAMAWLTKFTSVAIYDSIEHLQQIHLHNGATRILFLEIGAQAGNLVQGA